MPRNPNDLGDVPELPEVEIARRNLRRWLRGKKIIAAKVPPSRIVRGNVARFVVGKTVEDVERRGKWLKLIVPPGELHSHLGMTGKWVRRALADPPERFERARLDVAGASVRYLDPRLFGRLFVGENP